VEQRWVSFQLFIFPCKLRYREVRRRYAAEQTDTALRVPKNCPRRADASFLSFLHVTMGAENRALNNRTSLLRPLVMCDNTHDSTSLLRPPVMCDNTHDSTSLLRPPVMCDNTHDSTSLLRRPVMCDNTHDSTSPHTRGTYEWQESFHLLTYLCHECRCTRARKNSQCLLKNIVFGSQIWSWML
jgi:hypothetical protein